ncbi:MAG: DNA-processing protein DprA [Planctomycetales bacterium]|nr:DNA-processing protein DprA [Planctomycetales bacterium]
MPEPTDAELEAEVRLAMVRGVGPRLRQNLAAAFGDAASVLAQPASQLQRVDGIGGKLADRIAAATEEIDAAGEVRRAAERGITIVTPRRPGYPRTLEEIPDPPAVLYLKGDALPADQLAVAIVGTRHATRYGLQNAERLAAGLARAGVTVVSGMARGIDTAAHRGALEAGGRTIAVLAGGLLKPYPPENAGLALEIAAQGCVMSEAPLLRPPFSGAFPQRNRVISGLSLGTIVVQAADRSGALITAHHAAEQGREVFAVPGPVDCRLSRGCHSLIQQGAKLVTDVEDVLEELGPLVEGVPLAGGGELRHVAELDLNEVEHAVLQSIEASPTLIDTVVQSSGVPVHRVLSTLSVLEMRGLVRRVGGAMVARV